MHFAFGHIFIIPALCLRTAKSGTRVETTVSEKFSNSQKLSDSSDESGQLQLQLTLAPAMK
jgi:hypothetical protein